MVLTIEIVSLDDIFLYLQAESHERLLICLGNALHGGREEVVGLASLMEANNFLQKVSSALDTFL